MRHIYESDERLLLAWQRAYFDVRVFNPTAPSYAAQKFTTLTEKHEKEKKKKYGLRIKEIEKGSFTPLVFTRM